MTQSVDPSRETRSGGRSLSGIVRRIAVIAVLGLPWVVIGWIGAAIAIEKAPRRVEVTARAAAPDHGLVAEVEARRRLGFTDRTRVLLRAGERADPVVALDVAAGVELELSWSELVLTVSCRDEDGVAFPDQRIRRVRVPVGDEVVHVRYERLDPDS